MEIDLSASGFLAMLAGGRAGGFVPEPPKFAEMVKAKYGKAAGARFYGKDARTGVEYYMPVTVTFAANTILQTNWGAWFPEGQMITWDLPFPIISISQKKHIVDTLLTERQGTFKELINGGEYDVTIKGFCINNTNELPEDDIIMLQKLAACPYAFELRSALTDIFLMSPERGGAKPMAVVKDLKLPDMRGVMNVKSYELTLVSDLPFSLVEV
jgi:hypothetical protein